MKDYFEKRAEDLGLELTIETIDKIVEMDADRGDYLNDVENGN